MSAPAVVEALVEGGDWSGVDVQALAARAVAAALAEVAVDAARVELCVLFTDDAAVARLNARFRGKPTPTNVLSWPAFDLRPSAPGQPPPTPPLAPLGLTPLGDVALAAETVAQEAQERNLALDAHAAHLVVHGVMHLLGYDHENDADAMVMQELERAALGRLGIGDPYS